MTNWPAVDDEYVRTLPPILAAIVRALGLPRTNEFLHDYGGHPITMPKHSTAQLGLSTDEIARLRVTLEYHIDARNRITLPKLDKIWQRSRNDQIRREKHRVSIAQQARLFKLTTRQVQNIRGQESNDDLQGSLF